MLIEKYLKAKEHQAHIKEIDYKNTLLDLYDRVTKALDMEQDYILYDDTLHSLKSDFASKFGFKIEGYNWGTYVYFNEKGLKKLEKQLMKIGELERL